jgi:hypothetical protein
MSHFTVMVIGPNYESQLAPYHEFESTGENNQYVQDVDITDEIKNLIQEYKDDENPLEAALEDYGLENCIVDNESDIDREHKHKFGYAIVVDEQLIKAVNRTNPNKKWDWYQVGGRWSGMLKLKSGSSRADWARKGDIDWEGMRNIAANEAGQFWDKVQAVAPNGWKSWEDVRDQFANDIDAARNAYHTQAGRQALQLSKDNELMWVDDDVLVSREEYVQNARDSASMTFAVIKDSQWMERGSMGWWGISVGNMPASEWYSKMAAMIDELDDNTLITIVDCHI